MHTPINVHWLAVKRIMLYLYGTFMTCLHFTSASELSFHGFSHLD
jgi:hypothetical protein